MTVCCQQTNRKVQKYRFYLPGTSENDDSPKQVADLPERAPHNHWRPNYLLWDLGGKLGMAAGKPITCNNLWRIKNQQQISIDGWNGEDIKHKHWLNR